MFSLAFTIQIEFRVFPINHIARGDVCGRTRRLIIKRNINKGTNGERNTSRGIDLKDENSGIERREGGTATKFN